MKADVRAASHLGGKKAASSSLQSRGGLKGIRNSSEVIGRRQAYYEVGKKSNSKSESDPLKNLIKKKHAEGDSSVIREIRHNDTAYDIVLFNEKCPKQLANFCCNDNPAFLSPLCFDFSFDFGKKPTNFFVFIGTFRNTTLYTKGTKTCPAMLGPLLMCHSKGEPSTHLLCDQLVQGCEGLEEHLKVIGADGEKSIHNQCLAYFKNALLLLCFKHQRDNVSDYTKKHLSFSLTQREGLLDELFGSSVTDGIVDADSLDDFDRLMDQFYVSVIKRFDEEGEKFVQYLRKFKQNVLLTNVSKLAVQNAGICVTSHRFYNNASESINKMLKSWMQGPLDIEKFVMEYEKFVNNQECQVQMAFLNLESYFEVRPEFIKSKLNFELDFWSKLNHVQERIRNSLSNLLVDPQKYEEVISVRLGPTAVEASRERARSMIIAKENMCPKSPLQQRTPTAASTSAAHDFETVFYMMMDSVRGNPASTATIGQ